MRRSSSFAAPTEQSWTRSAKLTEFARLKETVQRLETSSREQLALENETQNVFEYMKTELGRIKKSIGALSGVVDEELAALRHECTSLREELTRVVDLTKTQGASTLSLITEARKRDSEWMQLTFSQVRETCARLEVEVKESKSQLLELSNAHASSVARLGADLEVKVAQLDSNSNSLHRQMGQLSERMAGTEAKCNTLAMELDGGLRSTSRLQEEHESLVAWSKEAQPQLASLRESLKGFESVQALTESVHTHTAALQQRQDTAQQQLAMASEELSRHRDAIVLVVETVDNLSRDSKAAQEGLGAKLQEVSDTSDQRARQMEKAASNLSAECGALREGARRCEQRLQEQHEAAALAQIAQDHSAEWTRRVDDGLLEIKQELSTSVAQLRQLKAGNKDVGEGLQQHKATVRRAFDDFEKRQEAMAKAAAIFSEALHISNPLTMSTAAAAV